MAEIFPLPRVISPVRPDGPAPARAERDAQRSAPPPPPPQAAPIAVNRPSSSSRGNYVDFQA
jgi:hypothetical protein